MLLIFVFTLLTMSCSIQSIYFAESQASDYHPLHQVSFYTSAQISCSHLGPSAMNLMPQQQMMLIHNQSFSIQFQNMNQAVLPGQHLGTTPNPVCMSPPSYEETVSTMSDGRGGTVVIMKNGSIVSISPPVCILN